MLIENKAYWVCSENFILSKPFYKIQLIKCFLEIFSKVTFDILELQSKLFLVKLNKKAFMYVVYVTGYF